MVQNVRISNPAALDSLLQHLMLVIIVYKRCATVALSIVIGVGYGAKIIVE